VVFTRNNTCGQIVIPQASNTMILSAVLAMNGNPTVDENPGKLLRDVKKKTSHIQLELSRKTSHPTFPQNLLVFLSQHWMMH